MPSEMVVLGIDPGTRRVGYGLIKKSGQKISFLDANILKIKSLDDVGALGEIKSGLRTLIRKWQPEVVALEKIFFSKNQKTGLQVAQARGVILLTAAEAGLRTLEFSPNEVKLGLTGYGFADKKSVLKMTRLILGRSDLDLIDDASDALGIAIFAARARNIST